MNKLTKNFSFKLSVVAAIILIIGYFLIWRFMPLYSFVLLLPELVLTAFYFIVAIRTIVFWIKQKSKYRFAYAPFVIMLLGIAIVFFMPSIYKNKHYPVSSYRLCSKPKCECPGNFYIDYYRVIGGGYMTTDVFAIYVTDRKNFNVYAGFWDGNVNDVDIECKTDKIITTQISYYGLDRQWSKPKIIEQKTFGVKQLIK